MLDDRQKPIAIKIIVVYFFLLGILTVIISLILMFELRTDTVPKHLLPTTYNISESIFSGFFMLLFAVPLFAIAFGLWKRKEWARIVAIIIAAYGTFTGITSALNYGLELSFISLIFDVFALVYLGFSKQNKNYFS